MLRGALASLGFLIAAAAAVTGVGPVEASGGERSGGCPSKSTVLAQTGTAAVVSSQRGIVACLRKAPASEVLTEDFETLFRPPALAIKGTRVAFAVSNFEDPHDVVQTSIYLLDLSRRSSDGSIAWPLMLYSDATRGSGTRVIRIVLRKRRGGRLDHYRHARADIGLRRLQRWPPSRARAREDGRSPPAQPARQRQGGVARERPNPVDATPLDPIG